MEIFNSETTIKFYTYNEEYIKTSHHDTTPVFTRSPFCVNFDNKSGLFVALWDLTYIDDSNKDLLLNLKAKSTFEFIIGNKEKDLEDFTDFNNEIYNSLLLFIKGNSMGFYDNLPKPSFPFIQGFDVIVQYGFYK